MRLRCDVGKNLFFTVTLAFGLSFSIPPAHAVGFNSSSATKTHGSNAAESGNTPTKPSSSDKSARGTAKISQAASRIGAHPGNRVHGQYTRAVFPGRVVHGHAGRAGRTYAYRGPTLQCVAFARTASNISLSGNASNWWDNAAGIYTRGQRPESGSVLAFTANGHMRLGHVAVVSRVINGREIEIDHANWAGPGSYSGGIARSVPVVDVSERNDWTAVRVGLGRSGEFGSVYPTYGFIYDQADTGVRVASVATPAPTLALNPAPRDLRSVSFGRIPEVGQTVAYDNGYEEVAEAPQSGGPAVTRHSHTRHHH